MEKWIGVIMVLALLLGGLGQPATPARAAGDLYVSKTGADSGSCDVANPCLTIAYAVSQAADGDTIHIGGGTYTESGVSMNMNINFVGAGTEAAPLGTWVDGGQVNRVFWISTVGGTSSFSGMGITGGAPVDYLYDTNARGGGILAEGNLRLDNVVIKDNVAYWGGGVYTYGDVTISNSRFEGNRSYGEKLSNAARYGGGGLLVETQAVITDTDFIANSAEDGGDGCGVGGGLAVHGDATITGGSFISHTVADPTGCNGAAIASTANLVISGTQVLSNTSGQSGGAIVVDGSATLVNSLFRGNASTDGSAGALYTYSDLTATNTQFISNTAYTRRGALEVENNATLTDCVFQGNVASGDGTAYAGAMEVGGDLVMTGGQLLYNVSEAEDGAIYASGSATISGTLFEGNQAGDYAGALEVGGVLNLTNSSFLSNTAATNSGAISVDGDAVIHGSTFQGNRAEGGNDGALTAGGGLDISESRFAGNHASGYAGALEAINNNPVTLLNTSFISNTTGGEDAAFYLLPSTLVISGSLFQGNQAGTYGGVGEISGDGGTTVDIQNTRFINNSAQPTENSGALKFISSGTSDLANVVFAGNNAQTGGAIYVDGAGTVNLKHASIGNPLTGTGAAVEVATGDLNVVNTIIANYQTGLANTAGTVNSSYSLYNNTTNKSGTIGDGTGDLLAVNPRFVSRANNNLMLLSGSPALGAGVASSVAFDILGSPRGDPPTIGAYELPASSDASLSGLAFSGLMTPAFVSSTLTYLGKVANDVNTAVVTPTVTDASATIQWTYSPGTTDWFSLASGSSTGPIPLNIETQVTIRVTAADGTTTQDYFIAVSHLPPSSDASLKSLVFSTGILTPAYISTTLDYTATVPYSVSTLTFTPTVNESHAQMFVQFNGQGYSVHSSGSPSGPHYLNQGENTVKVKVMAWDSTQQIYTVVVTRLGPPSSDAFLSALALSQGTLTPDFFLLTNSYAASIPYPASSLVITPTADEAHAAIQVKVNGGSWSPVVSGQGSSPLAMNVGLNTVVISVTAQDLTENAYTIDVTRWGDSSLSGLALSAGALTPAFISTTVDYTATVANGVSSLVVTPTAGSAQATLQVRVNGGNWTPVTSGSASDPLSLDVGANTIEIMVTAADFSNTTYTITVTRRGSGSSDSSLSGLALSQGALNPDFEPATVAYTALVSNSVSSLTVTPSANEGHATLRVRVNGGSWSPVTSGSPSGPLLLDEGENTIEVEVTAQDLTTTTYTITVTRGSGDSSLSGLDLGGLDLVPPFDPGVLDYQLTVTSGVSLAHLAAEASEGHATIQVRLNNGEWMKLDIDGLDLPLEAGLNTIEVLVTAQDGSSTTYTILITRQTNDPHDSHLGTLDLGGQPLAPPFDPALFSYYLTVGSGTSSLHLAAQASSGLSSIQARLNNGEWVDLGAGGLDLPLHPGLNVIEVKVTAQDGTTTTYTILVRRGSGVIFFPYFWINNPAR
jgi:predicted outer membrane repeat protein